MLWTAFFLGVSIGLLRKGSFKNLINVQFNRWYFALIAFLIQAAVLIDFNYFSAERSFLYPYLYVGSFVLLVLFIISQNLALGTILIGLGLCLNLFVIAANQGKMPVDSSSLPPEVTIALENGDKSPFHQVMQDGTVLSWLGDRITVPLYRNQLFSIGDLLLGTGIVFYVQNGMLKKYKPKHYRSKGSY